jgi:hypothetical protein
MFSLPLAEPILKREQSEEEMAVGGGGHGAAPDRDVVPHARHRGTTTAPGRAGSIARKYYPLQIAPVHTKTGCSSEDLSGNALFGRL